jgi:hypothetical protein
MVLGFLGFGVQAVNEENVRTYGPFFRCRKIGLTVYSSCGRLKSMLAAISTWEHAIRAYETVEEQMQRRASMWLPAKY